MANMINPLTSDETFRDTLSSITGDGKRNWIFPKKPEGFYYRLRSIVSWVLIGFLFAGPFITISGNPLILLNVIERKFVLFGVVFWPQDFYLLFLAMMTLIVFIVLFTAIWGRFFCGWICPQTIFLEMLFRKIEYAIDGDSSAQKRLSKASWSKEKIIKRLSKHGIFLGLSFLIANTFLAYVIGKDELWSIVTAPPSEHLGGLTAITIFSLVFYGVFARFREQVCLVACPYGRLQSVLVDNDSIAVTYDFARGEPRSSIAQRRQENKSEEYGDCIECFQCVKVCPTGIDIRDGIQLECINCTACMDACDAVMNKIGKPDKLIRYTSYNAVAEVREQRVFTPRVIGYLVCFALLFSALTYLLLSRPDVETVILREPGMLYNELPGERYSNFYNARFFNKTFVDQQLELKLISPKGELQYLGEKKVIPGHESVESRLMIFLHRDDLTGTQTPVEIGAYHDGQLIQKINTRFLGPGFPR